MQGNFVGVTISESSACGLWHLLKALDSTAGRSNYVDQFSHSFIQPVKAFVLRPALRDQIRTQLCGDGADTTKTLVVWGLGGAGKTQLVLDYVRQYRTDYKATFWIEAGSKESLDRDIVYLYQTLYRQTTAAQEPASVENAIIGVKSWFSGRQGPWLMVFDGADAIENKGSSEYIDIKHFIPDVASLHVVVTSRSSTAKNMTLLEGVQVGEMEETQAVKLFCRYSRFSCDDARIVNEVRAIVKELGCLALAVTLAATYVGATPRLQSDINAYLPEYRRRRHELLGRKPESLVHQYSESVLTTWETSYRAIANQCPEASVLMKILSCLNFDDIFLGLFGINEWVESMRSTDDEAGVSWRYLLSPEQILDEYKIEECFRVLQKYSLVEWKADQQSYAMHKLVHAWGYDRLTRDEQRKVSRAAFGLVTEMVDAVKGNGTAPEDKLRAVPHVMANFATLGGKGRFTEDLLDGLENVSLFLQNVGKWSEERLVQEFVLNKRRQILGEKYPDTISTINNLAIIFRDLGQLDDSGKFHYYILNKIKQIFGEKHLDTISTINNLANIFKE